jgi:hypothetical protein
VRHTGFETRASGEGSSPRCGHGGGDGSNFPRRKWLGRPEDGVEGLDGEVEGGWHARGVKKAYDRATREEGVARRPFSGQRHARGGGPVGARPREGGGGLATACPRAGRPGHECVRSGGGSPGTAAPGHARGRQGKRERWARARETDKWGPSNRGNGAGDRWGRLQCRWFKLNQTELNQFERI